MRRLILNGSDPVSLFRRPRYYWYDGKLGNISEVREAELPKYWALGDGGGKYLLVRENGWLLQPQTLLGTRLRFAIFASEGAILFDDGCSVRNISSGEVKVTVEVFFMRMKVSIAGSNGTAPVVHWCRYRTVRGGFFAPELEHHEFEPINDIMAEINGPNQALWLHRWTTGAAHRNLFMTELTDDSPR
jgi:hypothetical protein